jgi:peptidyl-prolyl cis-trans isomerase C
VSKNVHWGAPAAAAIVFAASMAFAADAPQGAAAPAAPAAAAAEAERGAPLARVNGVAIAREDFERNLAFVLQRNGDAGAEQGETGAASAAGRASEELRAQVLDRLIDEELLFQESGKRHMAAGVDAVDAEIAQARRQFPTPEAFAEALGKNRLTEEGLRALIARNLSIQNLVEKGIGATVIVSDAEIHEFYTANAESFAIPEQVRARHILVQFGETDDEAAREAKRAKAEALLAQLKGGASFEELARANSECPSAAEGGDLGFFERGQMVPEFDAAVWALKPGETSGVVETEYGYHIVRLEEKKPAGMVPESDAAAQIAEYLRARKTEAAVEALVKELRATAKIEKGL